MGVGVGFDNIIRVYSCSWTTFIFFVSFNSDIWFWLNFGVILYFLGTIGLILGLGKGSKNVLGSTHVVDELSFSMILSILLCNSTYFWGHFWLFRALMGYLWGWGRVQKLFWSLLMCLNNFHFLCFLQFWHLTIFFFNFLWP